MVRAEPYGKAATSVRLPTVRKEAKPMKLLGQDTTDRRLGVVSALLWLLALVGGLAQPAAAEEEIWLDLKGDLFGERTILDGSDWLALEAPKRAHDAAIVPIEIVALQPQGETYIQSITLVIDANPAPVAAVFHLGPQSGYASIGTRVRVNAYSHVRAIAETSDGRLFMTSRFVKASGGCSAPAGKDMDEAMANLGKMRLRQFGADPFEGDPASDIRLHEAQLQIRHPNNSGLQMDQITRYYIPAHFVRDIEILRDGEPLLTVEGAISLSEDPSLRFRFLGKPSGRLTARVTDTEDQTFVKSWEIQADTASGS